MRDAGRWIRTRAARLALACVFAALGDSAVLAQDTERLYREACNGGDFVACNVFGLMYETGEGVRRDLARAGELYERACEGGALMGCTNRGLLFETGRGVARDLDRAIGLYRVACEGGESLGCERLREVEERRSYVTATPRFVKRGRIGDAESGEALAGAIVEVPALAVRAISDPFGRVSLPGLPEGTHALRVDRAGYDPILSPIEVPGGEFVVLLSRTRGVDGRAPGRVVGRVLQEGDQPLAAVEVSILGNERARTLSNDEGRFTLRDVPPGLAEVRFARLGYAPRTATIVVHPERTVEVSTTMVTEPVQLEPIQVMVRSTVLERNGFYERAERGWGHHFSPHDLHTIDALAVSEIVRWRVPGVTIEYDAQAGVMRAISRRSDTPAQGPCPLAVFVDGVPSITPDIDQIAPDHIEAIEVYNGVSLPIEFSTGPNVCGAVLLWTRRGN